MNRKLFARALGISPFVVTTLVLVAIAISSGPLASSAQQAPPGASAAPPANLGGPIALAADFANALASWTPPDPATLHSSPGGGSDTWYQPCTSGSVDFAATGGWCWVPELKLFYNINSARLLDPFSGRLMVVDAAHTGLLEVIRTTDEELQPPTFVVPARTSADPLSLKCVPGQARLIGQHVSGLRTNAAHTDSPIMRAMFVAEADWWTKICA